LFICGTLYVDRGVPKEMKEKIKYLKKWGSKYCCKGQILVHVWQGETMRKPEIIEDGGKLMWDVDKADQILNCYP
jgi:hypothetical protein